MSGDNPGVILPPPLIFAVLLGLGLLIDTESPANGLLLTVSVLVGAAGLALGFAALDLFRRRRTRPEPWKGASVLVANGVYRYTRNPMYLGMALLSLAGALLFASLAAAFVTLVAVFVIDRTVVRREEAYLQRRFGTEYLDYRERVRRWL